MPFHWQSNVNVQNVGVEDMVLLRHLSDDSIVDNLKKRLAAKSIFTYIGGVLISVNPFKEMPYFTEKDMELYQGAAQYENPPHIYALADEMYRNMMIDSERQCVIISGESGAGKTVCAKYIMSYIARISGGGSRVQHVKDVIIKSNPLLESFGNAATLRNWNSSRFGKYVEIIFGRGGEPIGGRISNFLLEKSRVVSLGKGERNFHIFYQLLAGADHHTRDNLGISSPDYYSYLNQSGCYMAEGTEDAKEYAETLQAMQVVGIPDNIQLQILQLVSAILHIGNISFVERQNYAAVVSDDYLQFPAYLLGLTTDAIKEKITTRKLESKWGKEKEEIDVNLNVEQAVYTRDAWVKALYSRLFDYLVSAVNKALDVGRPVDANLSVGILDIYGFEIFDNNGFEQFCINFVNEKLQQIFIELTLKAEQEEYVSEGIQWTPIAYFNNKIVCDLIEAKKPPGIMCLLDDICAQIHGQSEGVDAKLLVKLNQQVGHNEHFRHGADCFIVTHYAGEVVYQINGFCDRNRDVLYADLIQLMQSSNNEFMRSLFPENVGGGGAKSKPTSASTKIRTQANQLVESLMKCTPHYIRCIKPNETKRPLEFDSQRVLHQVKYLGLKENIRVRRAGFAYRRLFEKFLWRYAILCTETWPKFNGPPRKGCELICRSTNLSPDQYQLGNTKIFIKNPESLFLLEELRERKYDAYARTIQKAFRKFTANKHYVRQKEQASDLFFGKKERRRHSLNRNFVGDYIGMDNHPALQVIVGRRERIDFAHTINKYDRKFKVKKVDLLVTAKNLTLVGREIVRKGPNKGKITEVLKRQIPLDKIQGIGLSPLQDDFLVVYVEGEYSSLLETPLKTELISALSKRYKERTGRQLPLDFKQSHLITLKKTRYDIGTPSPRQIQFSCDSTLDNGRDPFAPPNIQLKPVGKVLQVSVPPGLPNNTRPMARPHPQSYGASNSQARAYQQHQRNRGAVSRPAMPLTNPNQIPSQQKVATNFNNSALPNGLRPVLGGQAQNLRTNTVHPVQDNGQVSKPRPAPKPKPMVKPQGPVVKALYPYEAQDTDELSFKENQIIELLQKDESGWWQGRIGAKTGLFPANYIEEV
ncbi:myosin head (motor domain) domain-containing protein [Ditylenchus destructor]|nr:myosin head (motor domain) domain-containing protein [Ditylenchus destructor]